MKIYEFDTAKSRLFRVGESNGILLTGEKNQIGN